MKLINQKERALWKARNTAIKESKGEYLLFFDDDSRVESDWIYQHLKALDFFKVDISDGVSLSVVGGKIPVNYSFFFWADQFDSGNALVKRNVFSKTGLFDLQFDKMRMGDGEFGLRAYLNGFRSISNPHAKRIHLKVSSGGLREMGSWDGFRPKSFLKPKPIPSVIYFFKKYFPSEYAREGVILGVLLSIVPYKYKGKRMMLALSVFLTFLLLPLIAYQVLISYRKANEMLRIGSKIEWLE
jgi:glycosyltransferase involved in cell wall biosynthesis